LTGSDPIAYFADTGSWKVLPATTSLLPSDDPYPRPVELNRWEAYDVPYLPITNGVPNTYDSGDPNVIDEHLWMMSDAGIDYILFDLTNGYLTDGIYLDAIEVCKRVDAMNASGLGHLEYAVAIGNPPPGGVVARVEAEAQMALRDFVNPATSACGNSYFHWEGKPLLTLFSNYSERVEWETSQAPKPFASQFTMRFGTGRVIELDGAGPAPGPREYPSATGQGCGVLPTGPTITPPAATFGTYLGWGTPWGSVGTGPAMIVMPGWNPHNGEYVARSQNGSPAGFYTTCAWDRVIAAKPPMVVINSFNEYMEESSVAPTDTSGTTGCQFCSEGWPTPSFYWDLTVSRIDQYRSP